MIRRALLTAALLGAASPPAPAISEGIWVEANIDCGNWVRTRAAVAAGINPFEGYLLGLLDGLSLATWADFWRGGGTSVSREQAFLWMDKYCREEPLSNVLAGAFVLYKERVGRPVHPAQR